MLGLPGNVSVCSLWFGAGVVDMPVGSLLGLGEPLSAPGVASARCERVTAVLGGSALCQRESSVCSQQGGAGFVGVTAVPESVLNGLVLGSLFYHCAVMVAQR